MKICYDKKSTKCTQYSMKSKYSLTVKKTMFNNNYKFNNNINIIFNSKTIKQRNCMWCVIS